MVADSLRDRLARDDHEHQHSFMSDRAHHPAFSDLDDRVRDLYLSRQGRRLAVIAEWLREKAAQTQTASDLLPASQELEVRAIARMLHALARSITESTEEESHP